jgi:hypothetical protein
MLSSCDRAPRDRYARTCVLILDKYRGDGRRLIAERLQAFRRVIRQLEDIYNVRPFPHQTAQSLTELYLLVLALRPRTIFELGAGSRSSTVALAAASATLRKCTIYSLDICSGKQRSAGSPHAGRIRPAPAHPSRHPVAAAQTPRPGNVDRAVVPPPKARRCACGRKRLAFQRYRPPGQRASRRWHPVSWGRCLRT